MKVYALFEFLAAKGIVLHVSGDRLLIDSPVGILTTELKAELAASKLDLIKFLSDPEITARELRVHDMFIEARARLGSRDLEERSITSWLRRYAPGVAALWPDAPLAAAWFDWRLHVGSEHLEALDRAFEAVTAQGGPRE